MAFESILVSTFVYLLAAVVSVPVAKKLGLSSVLGYLVAGIIMWAPASAREERTHSRSAMNSDGSA